MVIINLKNIKLLNRLIVYIIGLFILALGVAFSVNSQLGISPVNSLPYVISQVLGKEMGTVVIYVFSFYILLQILILRKEFKWINLTQVIFSTIFGYFVNLGKYILGDFSIPTYLGQLTMMVIGIILVSLGISIYMNAKLINMPMEGLTQVIKEKFFKKLSFQDVKVIIDILIVSIGFILSLIFLDKVVGIREGTVLSAIFVGIIMKQIQKIIGPIMDKIC